MRWDRLFQDLEAQLAASERAELESEVADRTRRELAAIGLADRLRGSVGRPVTLLVPGSAGVTGRLVEVGADWLLLEEPGGRQALVPAAAVLAVTGLAGGSVSSGAADETGRLLAERLRLGYALRALARDRAPVSVQLLDGSVVAGTVDRVGADHLDVSEHPVGEARRQGAVHGTRTIPYAGLAAVRSR